MSPNPGVRENLVGGRWVGSRDGEPLVVLNPADQREVVGSVPSMTAQDVAHVYATAVDGAAGWRAMSSIQRGRVLIRAAALLRERRNEIARTLTLEMGKTLAEATIEVDKSADFFEYFGGLGRSDGGQVLAHERADVTAFTLHEPLGVVLAITPWNDPLLTPARKLAPALIAGNAVVLKPASYTPLVALELARCLHDAGLPAGVVNTVTGSGGRIGAALIENPFLAAVSFTGSNEIGAQLRRSLAERNIPLLAELGGKNAAVILGEADRERAVATIAAAAFAQAGQRCTATSRVIVEHGIYDEVRDRLAEAARALVIGPGLHAETTMGPVVAAEHHATVCGFIDRAVSGGASLLTGGGRPSDAALADGCYVSPTIVEAVTPASEIWREEVFGPVIALLRVEDEHQALTVLNDSPYGLAAALYTRDLGALQRFVAGARVGQLAVNLPTSGWDVHMPFGGLKASGSGHKEQGVEGLAFYRSVKTVAIAS